MLNNICLLVSDFLQQTSRHSAVARDAHAQATLHGGCAGARFDLLVIDPPWENASAARAQRYPTLPAKRLLQLPVAALLREVCTPSMCACCL